MAKFFGRIRHDETDNILNACAKFADKQRQALPVYVESLLLSVKTPDTIDFSFSDRASKDACFHFCVDVADVCCFRIGIG